MKKRFKKLFATIFTEALALQLTSCYSSTTCVGNITPDDPAVKVNKVMNHHFLFGLNKGGNTKKQDSKNVKGAKDYKVKKQHTFLDGFLEVLTLGIYNPTTTTYYVPLEK